MENSHNHLAFLDDLHISNVGSIKEKSFIDQTDSGIVKDEVTDVLNFLTTVHRDDFADLDFLNDTNMEVESCQPLEPYDEGNFGNDDDLNSAETKYTNCGPEPIRSDCMWSSSLRSVFGDTATSKTHHKGRKRDTSLTWSECAEDSSSIAPLEIGGANMIEGPLWNPLSTCNSETETDDSDREIDVETPDDCINPLLQQENSNNTHLRKKSIEPGI